MWLNKKKYLALHCKHGNQKIIHWYPQENQVNALVIIEDWETNDETKSWKSQNAKTEKIPTPPANCTKKQNTCRKEHYSFCSRFRKDRAPTRAGGTCSESTVPITLPPLKSVTIRHFYTNQSTFGSLVIQPFPRVTSPHAAIIQFGRSIVEVTSLGEGGMVYQGKYRKETRHEDIKGVILNSFWKNKNKWKRSRTKIQTVKELNVS